MSIEKLVAQANIIDNPCILDISMPNYLIENKEWIFSGIGVPVLLWITSLLKNRSRGPSKSREIGSRTEGEVSDRRNVTSTTDSTEVEQLAKRFRVVLELMNEDRNYSKFTISQLAQIMKLHRISELEDVFTGKVEPTFKFIEDFSNSFGVSKDWLIDGKGTPYANELTPRSDPMDYLSIIEDLNPDSIYFVREDSATAPAFILLKISKWKYLILGRTWHISDVVGTGGQRQLYSFYNLIIELRDKKDWHTRCWGLTLNKEDFNSLRSGRSFPGKYTEIQFSEDPWWDDLTDINHSYPIAENYERWHGKSFIKAQTIIKSYLSDKG